MNLKVLHTADPTVRKILETAGNIALSRAAVLISGESGTGKELLARYIHAKSTRATKPFYAINCAAVPEGLLESELFGYEKGAFTSADSRKIGKFEQADGSTFLLDEISEMPLLLQAKLLRVIQEGEIERLGGTTPIKVNVRIIATTNRNLAEMVKSGKFREDLYYRLNVIPITLPALRQRPRDIEMLSKLFAEISCDENGLLLKQLSDEAKAKLASWRWPGNVRELQNVVERSVLLSSGAIISADEILIEGYEAMQEKNVQLKPGLTVSEAERLLIMKTLEFTEQNRTRAAHMLGISIRTLRNKLNEYKRVVTP
ncbi:MAG: sigma-54-dependent Fis family transcriptional regulator [Pseudobdellovibrionaceae bacterium]|nr:sigma-54-dependent Fis family transcriptional regulator [Bdellovibrionales bacterium]USN47280.1 MAG: sigma-54-dependent Fis family transcriptional regulator [Pseudobdellovibrionaceae bacterium]